MKKELIFNEDPASRVNKKRSLDEISSDVDMILPQSINIGDLSTTDKKGDLKLSSKVSEKPICSICAEEIGERKGVIDCKHSFCVECISKWAEVETSCPNCKQEFTQIKEKVRRKAS